MIEQIYSIEQVQTGMAVMVDGKRIDYARLTDKFGYLFDVTVEAPSGVEDAHEKIMKIVSAMESQSYDHGASWRRVQVVPDESLVERYGQYTVTVEFRVRDAG